MTKGHAAAGRAVGAESDADAADQTEAEAEAEEAEGGTLPLSDHAGGHGLSLGRDGVPLWRDRWPRGARPCILFTAPWLRGPVTLAVPVSTHRTTGNPDRTK